MTIKKQEIKNKLAEIETQLSAILVRLTKVEEALGTTLISDTEKTFLDTTKDISDKFIDPFDRLIEG